MIIHSRYTNVPWSRDEHKGEREQTTLPSTSFQSGILSSCKLTLLDQRTVLWSYEAESNPIERSPELKERDQRTVLFSSPFTRSTQLDATSDNPGLTQCAKLLPVKTIASMARSAPKLNVSPTLRTTNSSSCSPDVEKQKPTSRRWNRGRRV